jgi:hypothetical protein
MSRRKSCRFQSPDQYDWRTERRRNLLKGLPRITASGVTDIFIRRRRRPCATAPTQFVRSVQQSLEEDYHHG